MWCLETIKQINAKHAEMGRDKGKPVDAKQVYVECGISVLGSASKPVHKENEDEQGSRSDRG